MTTMMRTSRQGLGHGSPVGLTLQGIIHGELGLLNNAVCILCLNCMLNILLLLANETGHHLHLSRNAACDFLILHTLKQVFFSERGVGLMSECCNRNFAH